ncbi:metalloregulator ArsR/SmtB family transcription factor [Amylibacter sp.]|nr:metalloregulator ArsR/SmtB family transcription factor [Amylibacter sp.]
MVDFLELEPKILDASKLMGMLSHPIRLKLMCLLQSGDKSVLNIAKNVNLSQPAMSHHLKKLRDQNLVKTRRDGQTIYYSLNGKEVEEILMTLHKLYCKN